MTQPDDHLPPRRRGFFASMAEGLTPKPVDEDDDSPLIAPRGVKIASIMTILAGLIYVFWYAMALVRINTLIDQVRDNYQDQVDTCNQQFGGFGTAITASSPTGTMADCQNLTQMTEDSFHSVRSFLIVVWVLYIVMGIVLVLAGWFLRVGRMWARRALITVTAITVIAALLLGISDVMTMISTLLLLVSLLLCYVSSGGHFFMRVKARQHT